MTGKFCGRVRTAFKLRCISGIYTIASRGHFQTTAVKYRTVVSPKDDSNSPRLSFDRDPPL